MPGVAEAAIDTCAASAWPDGRAACSPSKMNQAWSNPFPGATRSNPGHAAMGYLVVDDVVLVRQSIDIKASRGNGPCCRAVDRPGLGRQGGSRIVIGQSGLAQARPAGEDQHLAGQPCPRFHATQMPESLLGRFSPHKRAIKRRTQCWHIPPGPIWWALNALDFAAREASNRSNTGFMKRPDREAHAVSSFGPPTRLTSGPVLTLIGLTGIFFGRKT